MNWSHSPTKRRSSKSTSPRPRRARRRHSNESHGSSSGSFNLDPISLDVPGSPKQESERNLGKSFSEDSFDFDAIRASIVQHGPAVLLLPEQSGTSESSTTDSFVATSKFYDSENMTPSPPPMSTPPPPSSSRKQSESAEEDFHLTLISPMNLSSHKRSMKKSSMKASEHNGQTASGIPAKWHPTKPRSLRKVSDDTVGATPVTVPHQVKLSPVLSKKRMVVKTRKADDNTTSSPLSPSRSNRARRSTPEGSQRSKRSVTQRSSLASESPIWGTLEAEKERQGKLRARLKAIAATPLA